MNKTTHSRSALSWCWISILIIILDQITKFLAVYFLTINQPVKILPFFNLTLMRNTGAAWNFLAQAWWAPWLFGGFAAIISLIIIVWMKRMPRSNRWQGIALAFVLGGALGNLIDRIAHSFVIDFIQLHYQDWYWPAFNVADSAICIGAVMLAIDMLFGKKKS